MKARLALAKHVRPMDRLGDRGLVIEVEKVDAGLRFHFALGSTATVPSDAIVRRSRPGQLEKKDGHETGHETGHERGRRRLDEAAALMRADQATEAAAYDLAELSRCQAVP